jgi:hypothetical protein
MVPTNLIISRMLAETRNVTMEINSIISTVKGVDADIER